MSRKVIQVPMEEELLRVLDAMCQKKGRRRAEIIREACRMYLRRVEEESMEEAYIEGYQRFPEEPHLGEAQAAVADQVLALEEW
ncbi:MAG: ribbon-helix-helix protein, CopG family [Armatimonadota bacterium]|nr:ribbon-helix-helix protein, CopG family [Armatimonadota bacterium]